MLGEGKSLDEIVENMGMIIEGLSTTKAAYELAVQKNVELPITTAIYEVLYNNADVKEVITELMNRVGKNEIE